jgi:hypothetical protein
VIVSQGVIEDLWNICTMSRDTLLEDINVHWMQMAVHTDTSQKTYIVVCALLTWVDV